MVNVKMAHLIYLVVVCLVVEIVDAILVEVPIQFVTKSQEDVNVILVLMVENVVNQ